MYGADRCLEHVKNVVYKNQGLASADWNTELVDFDKFCVLADENSDEEGFLKILAPDVTAIDRGHGLYECVPTGYDKATARTRRSDLKEIWDREGRFLCLWGQHERSGDDPVCRKQHYYGETCEGA